MTANVLSVWGEILGIAGGGVALLIFGVFFAGFGQRWQTPPGSSGRRITPGEQQAGDQTREELGGEVVRADGYIESFGGVIEEAGGGPPLLVKISLVGIPLWWIIYVIFNWSQQFVSMRTFNP